MSRRPVDSPSPPVPPREATRTRVPVSDADVASSAAAFLSGGVAESDDFTKWADEIVDAVVVSPESIASIHAAIEASLTIADGRLEYGHLAAALNAATKHYRNAYRLASTATRHRKIWQRENVITRAAMRQAAIKSLQTEKAEGLRSKQITDADVESQMGILNPDEVRAQIQREINLETVEKSFYNLVDVAAERCQALRTLLGKSRGDLT